MNFLKKLKKKTKPKLVTLTKYKCIFKTVDGEWHEFDGYNYANADALSVSVPRHIIEREEYLMDDDYNMYPLENVICIKWEISDTIENVIKKSTSLYTSQVFYEKDDIKVWSEEE